MCNPVNEYYPTISDSIFTNINSHLLRFINIKQDHVYFEWSKIFVTYSLILIILFAPGEIVIHSYCVYFLLFLIQMYRNCCQDSKQGIYHTKSLSSFCSSIVFIFLKQSFPLTFSVIIKSTGSGIKISAFGS